MFEVESYFKNMEDKCGKMCTELISNTATVAKDESIDLTRQIG